MRRPVLSVLGAIAFGSAAPASAAISIAQELAFAPASAFPGFESSAVASGDTPFVFGDSPLFDATVAPQATLSFTDAGIDTQTAAYRGMLNASVLAVPEPTTWWAMIIGLGVIGYALRTRKRPLPQAV